MDRGLLERELQRRAADGTAWGAGDCSQRVCRGGSWSTVPRFARSAARHKNPLDFRDNLTGFRLARTLE
jgi:formylglycine-generating enzyme required for sulfatase activity